jgi:hypothetical protein
MFFFAYDSIILSTHHRKATVLKQSIAKEFKNKIGFMESQELKTLFLTNTTSSFFLKIVDSFY